MTQPPRPREAAFTALDLKSVADDGAFEGYASLFNRPDLTNDVVVPGAFADSIRTRGPAGIRMLFQHDPAEPIGAWDIVREDARGLYVQGRLTLGVGRAREVHALMRAGAIDGLSIGFKTQRSRRDRISGQRRLEKVDLWEISIVTFPMLPEARIAAVKSRPFVSATPTEREFERWLMRDAGLTRSEALAVTRQGHKGLSALRDAAGRSNPTAALTSRIRQLADLMRSHPFH